MTTDPLGGVWTYSLELASALNRHGVNVALATMGAPLTPIQKGEIQAIRNIQLYESSYKLEWMDAPWKDVSRSGEWLLELEQKLRPDVVHLNGYCHGDLPWTAPRIIVGHSCVLSWWRAVKKEPAPKTYEAYHDAVESGLKAADGIVAPSHAMLAELNDFYGPLEGTVIPNGRDGGPFRSKRKNPFIFSAGRIWDEAKNISLLADIAYQLPWPVYIAGEMTRPTNVEPAFTASGSASDLRRSRTNVPSIVRPGALRTGETPTLLGRLSPQELAPWFAKASIYALPARYEPFGISVLEAGLAGCALVLGNIPSLREIWKGAALFVNPEDSSALTCCLKQLAADPKTVQHLGALAYQRAIQFTPEKMASRYYSFYKEVCLARSAKELCAS